MEDRRRRARVLLVSSRSLRTTLFSSALYEFEDVVTTFEHADVFCPTRHWDDPRMKAARGAQHAVRLASGRRLGRRPVVPYPAELVPEQGYDLLFATFDNPWDLSLVRLVDRVRDRCAAVVCYMPEVWDRTFEDWRYRLSDFDLYDHVFLGTESAVDPFARLSGRRCTAFAPAVDCERFTPWERRHRRVIDVANLGRRMPGTHRALLRLARDHGWFYLYDDILGGHFDDPAAHRCWLADVLLRTRYNIANFSRCDEPEVTRGTREMGYRFIEGAAAGTVLLGAPPDTEQFARELPWEDAVIHLPVDAPDVADVLFDLERQPERVQAIRCRNIAGSLRRHDWVHRWQQVLDTVGLSSTPAMAQRSERLATEAERWDLGRGPNT